MTVVLVAEDEPMIARILVEKMTREGHAVTRVSDIAALITALPLCDVALVDNTLDADGIETMRGLAAAGIVARSGWFAMLEGRAAADGDRAVDAGAAGVILKPFKPTAVSAKVTALLDLARR